MNNLIDLRSDTVTKPCQIMRMIMSQAEVGDDVYGEDPTLIKLEQMTADIFGMEAALFTPSGTMANQLAILTHTARGDEVIVEENSHIYSYEVGGLAVLAAVMPKIIRGEKGKIKPEQLEKIIKPSNIHYPQPSLLCIENTHNFGGGIVTTKDEMDELIFIAHKNGINVHIDGARIFNAAVFLNIPVKELVKETDSVMFCLSKGLGAPLGSMLIGSQDFIVKARKYRKMLGGGIRQGGIVASAGIYALENLVDRLAQDHFHATKLAKGLDLIPHIAVDSDNVQTNIIMMDIMERNLDAMLLSGLLKEEGILANVINNKRIRFVTHRNITESDIDYTIAKIKKIVG